MSKTVKAQVADLARLQDRIKRDPAAYRDEFLLQHRHFISELELFTLNPSEPSDLLGPQLAFMSQVCASYPQDLATFPGHLMKILEQHATVVTPALRMTMVKALILMRNRNMIKPTELLPLCFRLFRCHDKPLRKLLHEHLVNDIRNLNKHKASNKLNRSLQSFLFTMLQDKSSFIAQKKSLDVLMELYYKKVWTDERAVNVIAQACFSEDAKTLTAALKFFLTDVQPKDDEEEEAEQQIHGAQSELNRLQRAAAFSKRARKRLKKAEEKVHKQNKQREYKPNWPALELIRDPQSFVEHQFGALKRSKHRFEVRVLRMNLISRLIAVHQLMLPNFFSWIIRYLQPHQQLCTKIMAITAQACHELVEPDVLYPVVRAIADHFISDRSSEEAMVVGLNTIREICARTPLVMNDTLLQDLVQYSRWKKNPGVRQAARSLMLLYRELNPALLARRDRGPASKHHKGILQYGEQRVAERVDGAELLEDELLEQAEMDGEFSDGDESSGDEFVVDTRARAPGKHGIAYSADKRVVVGANTDDISGDESSGDEEAAEAVAAAVNGDGASSDEEVSGGGEPEEQEQDEEEEEEEDAASDEESVSGQINAILETSRILTDEDFARIDELKEEQRSKRKARIGLKRTRGDMELAQMEIAPSVHLDEGDVGQFIKRRKLSKEERMESVEAGRVDAQRGSSKRFKVRTGSTTNQAKKKLQPFMLARKSSSVSSKSKRSASEETLIRRKTAFMSKSKKKQVRTTNKFHR